MNREKDTAVAASRGEGWMPMDTAPRDGTEFLARGHNWGIPARGRHRHVVKWLDDKFVAADDEDLHLQFLTDWMALTVNTSTPGNELEYNGLAATRMEELERRTLKLELAVSALMEGKND